MQPLAGGDTRGMIMQQTGANQQPVNSESFYKQSAQNVAADEMFFYKYFSDKMSNIPKKAAKKVKPDASMEGEDGMDEDAVWQALVQSRPDVEAPSDESDLDDEDLDEMAEAMSDSELEDSLEKDEDDDAEESDVADDASAELDIGIPEFNDSDFEAEENEFDEDEDDLLPSDDEAEGDDFTDFDAAAKDSKKRKTTTEGDDEEDKKAKKKKKVKLPAFASADEYMHLIDAE